MMILSMITTIISPCFAAASTSSQVVRNAQAMYDKITETYGSFHGYVPVLSNLKLSYQQTLHEAEFYNEVYDTIVDFGSTGIDLICSILTGGTSGALKEVREQAMNVFLDQLMTDLPKLTIEEYIYSQAKAGSAQVNISELMDIGSKIEKECGGKISSVSDAIRFIRVNQEIKLGFAALQMGRDLYYEQLNASPWDTLVDMFTKHSLGYISNKVNAGVLEQFRRDITTEKVIELFTLMMDSIVNPHYKTYMESVIKITKETETLISYAVDDFGKEPTVSPAPSIPVQTPPQAPPSIQTPTFVKCYYHASDYNEGYYEGEWLNGKPHGWGKLVYDDFDDGKFYSLMLNGTSIKALFYEGNFVDGFRSGYGTVTYERGYKDEGTFNGIWKADKITFEGKRWLKNDEFEGYWPVTERATSNVAASATYGDWVSTKQSYSITYHANGGQNAPTGQKKSKDTSMVLSTGIPTRAGYSFLGWSTSANATSVVYQPGDLYVSNSNVVLYAVWRAEKFMVSYNANGGQNAPAPQIKEAGKDLTLSANVPARAGYAFLGWSTSSTATKPGYYVGTVYRQDTNITLYAVWEKRNRAAKLVSARLETGVTGVDMVSIVYKMEGYPTGEVWLIFEDNTTGERELFVLDANDTTYSILAEYHFTPGRTYKVFFSNDYEGSSMLDGTYVFFSYPLKSDAFIYSTPSSWARESITRAHNMNLLPDYMLSDYSATATRIDFVRLAYAAIESRSGRMQNVLYNKGLVADLEKGPSLVFTDVPQYCGYDEYDQYRVAALNALGIINGTGAGKFEPNRAVTREEAAAMLNRVYSFFAWGSVKSYTFEGSMNDLYADNAAISEWAFYDVYNMRTINVMNGVGNNRFAPKNRHTVEESIVTLVRILECTS